jgi:hypothetical protein
MAPLAQPSKAAATASFITLFIFDPQEKKIVYRIGIRLTAGELLQVTLSRSVRSFSGRLCSVVNFPDENNNKPHFLATVLAKKKDRIERSSGMACGCVGIAGGGAADRVQAVRLRFFGASMV